MHGLNGKDTDGHKETAEIFRSFGYAPDHPADRVCADNCNDIRADAVRKLYAGLPLASNPCAIRDVIVRMGFRLAEPKEMSRDPVESRRVAEETLKLYVPLADRLGMGALRSRLEDACFRILQPTIFSELARTNGPIRAEEEVCLNTVGNDIRQLLEQNGINGIVQGRTKGIYSLFHKMSRRHCSFRDVIDNIGIRIIVPSVEQCYAVLELMHGHFPTISRTFDDYIAYPKKNGYQSLHTSVFPVPDVSHQPVEIQIRTQQMHREAELGLAAHWLYKCGDCLLQDRDSVAPILAGDGRLVRVDTWLGKGATEVKQLLTERSRL
jgi:(p)ppGpp synthase/HD superfamily hydrolase